MALLRLLALAVFVSASPRAPVPTEQLSGVHSAGQAAVAAGDNGYRIAGEGFETGLIPRGGPVLAGGIGRLPPGLGSAAALKAEAPKAEPPAGAVFAAEGGGAMAAKGGFGAAVGGNPAVGAAALGLGLALVGFMLGGPIGAVVGFLIGVMLGAGLTHCG